MKKIIYFIIELTLSWFVLCKSLFSQILDKNKKVIFFGKNK